MATATLVTTCDFADFTFVVLRDDQGGSTKYLRVGAAPLGGVANVLLQTVPGGTPLPSLPSPPSQPGKGLPTTIIVEVRPATPGTPNPIGEGRYSFSTSLQ